MFVLARKNYKIEYWAKGFKKFIKMQRVREEARAKVEIASASFFFPAKNNDTQEN